MKILNRKTWLCNSNWMPVWIQLLICRPRLMIWMPKLFHFKRKSTKNKRLTMKLKLSWTLRSRQRMNQRLRETTTWLSIQVSMSMMVKNQLDQSIVKSVSFNILLFTLQLLNSPLKLHGMPCSTSMALESHWLLKIPTTARISLTKSSRRQLAQVHGQASA